MAERTRDELVSWHRSQSGYATERASTDFTAQLGLEQYWLERADWHDQTAAMLEKDGNAEKVAAMNLEANR